MKSTSRIFLIGFSGSGKSTLGKVIARALKARFFDTDVLICRKMGCSVSKIFAEQGEDYFRTLEHQVIATITANAPKRMVVALGGGAFQDKRNRKLAREAGVVVYLSCSQRELFRRLQLMEDRPLLRSERKDGLKAGALLKQNMQKLLRKRRRYYNLADVRISTSNKSIRQTVQQLRIRLRQFDERH